MMYAYTVPTNNVASTAIFRRNGICSAHTYALGVSHLLPDRVNASY